MDHDKTVPVAVQRLLRLRRWLVGLILLAALIIAIALLNQESRELLMNWMTVKAWSGEGMGMYYLAALYVACLAIPFLPGVEVGLLLMVVYGRPGIALAWLGTLVGLNLAYLAGRLLGNSATGKYLARRAPLLTAPSGEQEGPEARSWLLRIAHRSRYLLLGILFNLPGNWLVGGGGGIAMVAGISERFRWPGFALTVALATILLPLLAWFGIVQLTPLLQSFAGEG